jgi:hypothetical protein
MLCYQLNVTVGSEGGAMHPDICKTWSKPVIVPKSSVGLIFYELFHIIILLRVRAALIMVGGLRSLAQ